MCLDLTNIKGLNKWNWDGDIIIHDPIVPSSRPVVGRTSIKDSYDIDVREFLMSEHNAVMQKTLRKDIPQFIQEMPGGEVHNFTSRNEGSFDYRANIISAYVGSKIKYDLRGGEDPWQFPDETLKLKKGDCEDRAFLLASLLLGSGISSFNVRVALGRVEYTKGNSNEKYDHMWVMYKNERGLWTLIEPLHVENNDSKKASKIIHPLHTTSSSARYIPYFIFNDTHLWAVIHRESNVPHRLDKHRNISFSSYLGLRKNWTKFTPKFAGEVHQTILNTALAGVNPMVLKTLNRYFSGAVLHLFGPTVDDIDRRRYDPRDHFDNCFIKQGWELVDSRLNDFKKDNIKNLDSFALAAHAISDFYAHSSYVHFANIVQAKDFKNSYASLYDAGNPTFQTVPSYGQGVTPSFDLTGDRFTVNKKYWKSRTLPRTQIAQVYDKKLISGRYAQDNDTWPGLINAIFIEGTTTIPNELMKDFDQRGWVPHHNEIAVDEEKRSSNHKLYCHITQGRDDRASYANQFRWRVNASIRHVRSVFEQNWTASKLQLTPLPE